MPHPSQAAVSRVGHQDMAHRPCSRVLSVPGLVSPEEVDLPVEVRLEPRGDIPREAPKVALEQGAQVAHQLHPLKVNRVVDVRPVCLALDPPPGQHAEGPLEVVDEQRSRRFPAENWVGFRANSLFVWEEHGIREPSNPQIITCYLDC